MMYELDMKNEGVIYECLRCGERMSAFNIAERGGAIKCIHCGFRVIKKVKPPVVKRVSTV